MKRLSDSKALISLISVIFILLAGMAMTGCGATLTQAAKRRKHRCHPETARSGGNLKGGHGDADYQIRC